MTTILNNRLRDLAFLGLLLSILILSAGGHIVAGDEETVFRVTSNLIQGKGIAIGRETILYPGQDFPYFIPSQSREIQTTMAVQGKDGQDYSWYGIGQSLAVIPLYLLGEGISRAASIIGLTATTFEGARLATAMFNPIILAAIAWLIMKFSDALGYKPRTGRWLAVAAVFTTFLFPYVKTFYSQPGVAFLLLSSVYCAYLWRKTGLDRWIWWFSAAIFLMLLNRISSAITIPFLLIYLFSSTEVESSFRERIMRGFPVIIGLGFAAVITGYYNWVRFGSLILTGYEDSAAWSTPILYGLYGQLFSPGKGVFFYAPVLIPGMIAGLVFRKKFKSEYGLITGLWITFLGFYSTYSFWAGGFNWGPRFLIPLIPLSIIPLGELIESPNKTNRLIFPILLILGLVIQTPAIIVDHSRYLTRHLLEDPVPEAYTVTIHSIKYAPPMHQWDEALNLVSAYLDPDTRERVTTSINEIYKVCTGTRDAPIILHSEFIRLNTLDFWWLHGPETTSPLSKGIAAIIFLYGLGCAFIYMKQDRIRGVINED